MNKEKLAKEMEEAIYFVIYHGQRHSHQLKNISKKLKRTAGTIGLHQ